MNSREATTQDSTAPTNVPRFLHTFINTPGMDGIQHLMEVVTLLSDACWLCGASHIDIYEFSGRLVRDSRDQLIEDLETLLLSINKDSGFLLALNKVNKNTITTLTNFCGGLPLDPQHVVYHIKQEDDTKLFTYVLNTSLSSFQKATRLISTSPIRDVGICGDCLTSYMKHNDRDMSVNVSILRNNWVTTTMTISRKE